MLSGERTAVLRGERFRPKTATSESMEGQISYVENNSEGDKIDEDEGKRVGIKKTMFLNNQNYGGRGPPQPRRIPPRNTNGAFSHYPRGVSPPTGHPPSQQQQQQQQYQQSSPAQQD